MTNFADLPWVNLTPHPVVILDDNGNELARWESAGQLRIVYGFDPAPDGTRTAQIQDIQGPAGWEDETMIIVSRAMAMAMVTPDFDGVRVVYPDLEVRDDSGRVIGCRTLTELVP